MRGLERPSGQLTNRRVGVVIPVCRLRVGLREGFVCFALALCPRTLSPRFVGYTSSPHFVPTLCRKRKMGWQWVSQVSPTAALQGGGSSSRQLEQARDASLSRGLNRQGRQDYPRPEYRLQAEVVQGLQPRSHDPFFNAGRLVGRWVVENITQRRRGCCALHHARCGSCCEWFLNQEGRKAGRIPGIIQWLTKQAPRPN